MSDEVPVPDLADALIAIGACRSGIRWLRTQARLQPGLGLSDIMRRGLAAYSVWLEIDVGLMIPYPMSASWCRVALLRKLLSGEDCAYFVYDPDWPRDTARPFAPKTRNAARARFLRAMEHHAPEMLEEARRGGRETRRNRWRP